MNDQVSESKEKPIECPDRTLIFRVRKSSNTHRLADAIARAYMEGRIVNLQAIAAVSVNQAVKSIAIARGTLAQSGVDIVTIPGFRDAEDPQNPGKHISIINFEIVARRY